MRRALAALGLLSVLFVPARAGRAESIPPHAGSATTVVRCAANFPVAPAPTWTAGGSCLGTALVQGAGIDSRLPITFQDYLLHGSAGFQAGFEYYEPCVANGQPGVVVSFARGTFAIADIPAEHPTGQGTTATVTGSFEWYRAGPSPVIAVTSAQITFANQPEEWTPLPIGPGVGTASFLVPTNYNPSIHQCGVGGPLFVDVAVGADIAL